MMRSGEHIVTGGILTTWETSGSAPEGSRARLAWRSTRRVKRDELVIGLGPGGGLVEVRDDAEAGYRRLAWLRVNWPAHDSANGETWPAWAAHNSAVGAAYPAIGDLDGDNRSELIVGLGTHATSGGWVEIRNSLSPGGCSTGPGRACRGWRITARTG